MLGLVGESGAGKSMIGRAIAHAAAAPASRSPAAACASTARTSSRCTPERRRALLGREIAFIPQEPLTALNPVLTIGAQFDEHLARIGVAPRDGATARWQLLDAVHLRDGADAAAPLSA